MTLQLPFALLSLDCSVASAQVLLNLNQLRYSEIAIVKACLTRLVNQKHTFVPGHAGSPLHCFACLPGLPAALAMSLSSAAASLTTLSECTLKASFVLLAMACPLSHLERRSIHCLSENSLSQAAPAGNSAEHSAPGELHFGHVTHTPNALLYFLASSHVPEGGTRGFLSSLGPHLARPASQSPGLKPTII